MRQSSCMKSIRSWILVLFGAAIFGGAGFLLSHKASRRDAIVQSASVTPSASFEIRQESDSASAPGAPAQIPEQAAPTKSDKTPVASTKGASAATNPRGAPTKEPVRDPVARDALALV